MVKGLERCECFENYDFYLKILFNVNIYRNYLNMKVSVWCMIIYRELFLTQYLIALFFIFIGIYKCQNIKFIHKIGYLQYRKYTIWNCCSFLNHRFEIRYFVSLLKDYSKWFWFTLKIRNQKEHQYYLKLMFFCRFSTQGWSA